jgi:dihydroorotate dehydrogenase electron transfer subunit
VALEDPVAALAPGQFLMVRFSWGPALPRPLSTVAAGPYGVDLLVKVDGVLRTALGSSPRGTVVEVRGPYGVPYIARIERQRKYVLVGGGSGVAPLHHFASAYPQLVETAAFGFRSREVEQLLPGVDFASEEETGETADDRLRSRWRDGLGIIACGPEPLLASIARRYRSQPDVYVSLETRLGCGFGACLSCSIRTTAGMRRVCVDGPLFRCSELPWLG